MANLVNPCVMQIMAGATSGNVNGGGFNLANANFPTDGVIGSGTGGSPTLTSATYTFATGAAGSGGDVGAWVWLPAQTNIIAGMYQIASVSGGVATLSAAIGAASVWALNRFAPSTVQGCATIAAPTGVTYGVDYSQQITAQLTKTDLTCTAASTTVTSAGGTFTPVMVGNVTHLTALTGTGAITGWYEIVQYTDAHDVVLDRTPTNGVNNITAGTYFVGGALSLGSSDTNIFTAVIANTSGTGSTRYYIKGGSTYTLSGSITSAPTGNAMWPIVLEGYNAVRGDRPTDSTRPTFAMGSNAWSGSGGWVEIGVIFTGTNAILHTGTAGNYYCKFLNTSQTAGRVALRIGNSAYSWGAECISYNGNAIEVTLNNSPSFYNFYAHDSNIGILNDGGSATYSISDGIIAGCVTAAISVAAANTAPAVYNNMTLYGAENKLGTGMSIFTGTTGVIKLNNSILYGFVTAISSADVNTAFVDDYNCYFNNTTDINDVTHWQKGAHDIAVNPLFANVKQITGSTATTTSGNHLVQTGATFITSGVTPGRDFVYISAGTGVTAGKYGILSVDSETQITTDVTLAADATADKVWQITTGRNFAPKAILNTSGYPGVFPGGLTTGFSAIGAVQQRTVTGSFASC